jgi:hypothetical protein
MKRKQIAKRIPLRWRYRARALAALASGRREPPSPPFVAVGALGGSGTRGVVLILRAAGVWMGAWNDPSTQDSLAMRHILEHHFETFEAIRDARETPPAEAQQAFRMAMAIHAGKVPTGAAGWGWKNPRSMWLVPFLAGQFPELRFVHLIRDGRSMAFSRNEFLLRSSGRHLLGGDWSKDKRVSQLRLWTRGNLRAREDALRWLGEDRYLAVRYEDLCGDPVPVIDRMLGFLGVDAESEARARLAGELKPSARLETWRDQWAASGLELEPETRRALELFGYPIRPE